MTEAARETTEVVGLLATQAAFEATVRDLVAAGFEHADLSVLASHESLDVTQPGRRHWRDVLPALVGELKYEGPLVASGAIALAGGPMAAMLAGLIGAAVGGMALKEVLGEVVATPHRDHFARSVEAGSLILWVCAETAEKQARAEAVLAAHNAENVHATRRPHPAET